MTQLQVDVPDDLAVWVQQKAKTLNLSVSEYIDRLIQEKRKNAQAKSNGAELNGAKSDEAKTIEELAKENGWPKEFLDLYGSSKDAPMERPDQGEFQVRETIV